MKLFYEFRKKESEAKKLHYDRNKYNIDLPKNKEEAKKMGWKDTPKIFSKYHQNGVPFGKENDKWVSPDGHREVVFSYKDGSIVYEVENMGTYNFFEGKWYDHSDHFKYDVDPWKEWGSGADDPRGFKKEVELKKYVREIKTFKN